MAYFVSCSADTEETIHSQIKALIAVIQEYRWIIDAYVSDFYTHKYWYQLPASVQEYFDSVEPPDLAWMLAGDGSQEHCSSNRIIPLSLLALHCCLRSLSMRRAAVDMESPQTRTAISSCLSCASSRSSMDRKTCVRAESLIRTDVSHKLQNYKNGQYMSMQHIFRKHVKPKKQHEIDQLSKVISLLCHQSSSDSVVDVGAGLGHLSRILTFKHGLKVTTLEAADGHAPIAAAYDRQLKKDVQKSNAKRKTAAGECESLHGAVKNSEYSSTSSRDSSHHDTECSIQNLGHDSNNKKHTDHMKKIYNVKSLSLSENVNYSTSSSLVDKECNKLHCSHHSLAYSGHHEGGCHAASDVCKPPCHVTDDDDDSLPNHVKFRVEPDIKDSEFLNIISKQTQTDSEKEQTTCNSFVLVGLHACGDLTPTLLRVFVNCRSAVGLVSVACCYMKVSSRSSSLTEATDLDNYPLSKFVGDLQNYHLSYAAREMACHFVDAYFQRLKDNCSRLKIHSFRAALQCLIMAVNREFRAGTVRLVSKSKNQGSFQQYVAENLRKVNIDLSDVPQDLMEYCEGLTVLWKRVVAFYTLRLSLAPALETLLLLDRALFLLENRIHCALVPVFDSSISPRNFALLAMKN